MKIKSRCVGFFLFAALSGFLLLNCKKEATKPEPLDGKLIGTWIATKAAIVGSNLPVQIGSMEFTFDADYTGEIVEGSDTSAVTSDFTWRVSGSTLYLKFTGSEQEMEFPIEFSGDNLVLTQSVTVPYEDPQTHQMKTTVVKIKITFRRG